MKKWSNLVIIVLFLLTIFTVPAVMAVTADRDFSENENRYLAGKPKLFAGSIASGEFMRETERYVDDQLLFREQLISLKTDLTLLTGCREVNGVYFGEDQYLFEKWTDQDFDADQLKENMDAVNGFLKRHQDQKISVMIVPTAGETLKNKLPKNAPMFEQSRAFDMLQDGLSDSLIDLRTILKAHNTEYIFYKTDHHWTTRGAFLAYQKWCEEKDFFVNQKDYRIEIVAEDFQGSLYSKVLGKKRGQDTVELYHWDDQPSYTVSYHFGKKETESLYALDQLQKKDKYQVFLNGNHPEVTIRTENKNGKHLLVIKDSFANAFIPFLIGDYESIHVIDLRYYNGTIDSYMEEQGISEVLFLYNVKNFCEDKNLSKMNP